MITPRAAQRLITRHCKRLPSVSLPIDQALGHVLCETVRATMDLPRFDNSAMDGYAVRADDTRGATAGDPRRLVIVKPVFAGDRTGRTLNADRACGIMTGAALPRGADAVIPIERAQVDGTTLVVDGPVERFRHVRRRGEETTAGAVVIAGGIVHPGTIACLATLGKDRVRVVRRPRVAVIATGDETVTPGRRLASGQIYDSNSPMIAAALRQMGIEPCRIRRVGDHYAALASAVRAALAESDVLIVTGGVSVGKRDFLRRVLAAHGVREVFWRVAQKPGKPLYFGAKGTRVVFGLPGNPASAFTCFYVYVYAALRRMAGYRDGSLPTGSFALAGPATPDPSKWRFLRAHLEGDSGRVDPLAAQGSHMITSLADANALIVLPPDGDRDGREDAVEAYRLPYTEDGLDTG